MARKPIGARPLTGARKSPQMARTQSSAETAVVDEHDRRRGPARLSTWTTSQLKRALRQITAEALKRGVK